jgi:hypothetical protein
LTPEPAFALVFSVEEHAMSATRKSWLPGLWSHQPASLLIILPLGVLAPITAFPAPVPNTLLHTFSDPLGSSNSFGAAVAISGTRVVVGTFGTNAYVYDLSTTTPAVPVATLADPDLESGDEFGSSVAIAGTRVVVGSPGNGPLPQGKVYVYDLASSTPAVPVFTLTNVNPGLQNSALGVSVAMSGARVVAGAWQGNIGSMPRGSVHVFDLDGGTPTVPVTVLANPGPEPSFAFGLSVAVSGARLVVGTLGDNFGGSHQGSAYVYDLAGVTPTVPIATLANPSPVGDDNFGFSVSISGNRVVVGARLDDTSAFDAGIAYVYDLASVTPSVPVVTLTNPSPAASDFFGASVASSGNLVVVGATGDDTGANIAGIAYVFDLAGATPTLPVATLVNPNPTDFANFGRSMAVDGTTVVGALGVYVFGPAPVLNLVNSAPNSATISWTPATSSGFVLQFTDELAPTNWLDAPSGTTNPVTVPIVNSSRFYRLFKP